MGDLCDRPFAHRGLHGGGRTENGSAAFAAAIEAGWGIECDVQFAAGGVPVVVHDARLERLTGHKAAVVNMRAVELGLLRLADGGLLPSLSDTLEQVGGRVPLLLEIKSPRGVDPALWRAVADALAGYRGPVGVMSFDPRVGRWFAEHAPGVTRGLVASNEDRRGLHVRLRHLLAIRMARPDFLAWDIRTCPIRCPPPLAGGDWRS